MNSCLRDGDWVEAVQGSVKTLLAALIEADVKHLEYRSTSVDGTLVFV